MATRGAYIGLGYIAGRGNCRIFHDMDSTKSFFAIPVKKDIELYVSRARVQFRKAK